MGLSQKSCSDDYAQKSDSYEYCAMTKLRPVTEIFALAAIGASLALLVDFLISKDASLVTSLSQHVDLVAVKFDVSPIPIEVIAGALVILGALSVHYLRPLTRKGALAAGFTAIAIISIFVS